MRILFESQKNGRLCAAMITEADVEVKVDGSETLTLYDAIVQADGGGWFEVVGLKPGLGSSMLSALVTNGYLDLTDFTVEECDRDQLYDEDEEGDDEL